MSDDRVIRFGRYSLHPTQGLRLGRREIRVTRKSLNVLRALAERSGQIVTKDELFARVWPDTAVTDSALTSCVQELRQALGDRAREPRYIETLHRRGFRFLVPATAVDPGAVTGRCGEQVVPAEPIVGREGALAALDAARRLADAGARQLVVVTGEAGIGKTALVEAFLAPVGRRQAAIVARAACIERFGAGEAYQPLLEALVRLCRLSEGPRLLAIVRQHAPSWLAQLPTLQTPAEFRALQRRTAGATRERMQRELSDCLEAMASDRTLVLWIDDVHWSDLSTLDWVSAFVQRPDAARVLIVVACRPGRDHPFDAINASLQVKPWYRQIALTGLDDRATFELVARRLDDEHAATEAQALARRIHAQTEGHPLYIRVMLDEYLARTAQTGGEPGAATAHPAAALGVPDSLRRVIERQFDDLAPFPRRLLEIASVAGPAWSAALIAAVSRRSQTEVESALLGLARHGTLVRHAGVAEWPDGTVADAFAFVHAVHGAVLRERLAAGARAELHRAIGACLETAFRGRAGEVAAQLAVHFREAREIDRAIEYLQMAGRNAGRRGAAAEARLHFNEALALLGTRPPGSRRDECELDLQVALGNTLMAELGWGAPEVEQAYDRARHLCEALEKRPQLFPSVWGLWLFRWGRGDLASARQLAATLEELSRGSNEAALHLQTHHALWATAFSRGDLDAACAHAAEGLRHYDPRHGGDHLSIYGNHDAGVCGQLFSARALVMQGRVARAMAVADDAVARSRRLDHPFTLSLALVFAAAVHHARRAPADVRDRAGEAASIAARNGFSLLNAWATALHGWALSETGSPERAVSIVEAAVAASLATGSHQFSTLLHGLLAEVLVNSGRARDALRVIDRALAAAVRSGQRFHEAELLRLRGELLDAPGRLLPGESADAETVLLQAVETADTQGARLFALRASLSLARLWSDRGRTEDARALIARAYADLPEDEPSRDVDAARRFLRAGF